MHTKTKKNSSYFIYNGQFYKPTHGTVMVSLVSPIISNLYLEHLEERVITIIMHPIRFYRRYVDDIIMIAKMIHIQLFMDLLNVLDEDIKFTCEMEKMVHWHS